MADDKPKLSGKSVAILELIAAGNSYEQILAAYPDFNYLDIFSAAREALDGHSIAADTIARVRQRHARAYERWSDGEDETLQKYISEGLTVARIAGQLQRRRSAIRSRIRKLDLVHLLPMKEQMRLRRLSDEK